MSRITKLVATGAGLAMFAAGAALAAEVKLPKQMTWTAYGTTSTGYQQSVAIGNVLKKNYGMQLNIKTGKNDVARMLPLKARKADFCACGIAFYFAHEGVFMFGKKNWGPQAISLAFASIGGAGIGVGVAKDTGVKKYSDLKGKRIAWIRGSPALNQNAASFLAYGGLTWKDVKRVEFGGWKDSINGIINNQVDAGTMSTISPHSKRIEASPRGLIFPQMDHNDKAAWKRMNSVAPWAQPHMATIGATVSKDKPWTGSGYFYPALVSNNDLSTDTVYSLVKGIDASYGDFKGTAPGVDGWHKSRQNFQWVVPWHSGAIKFWKEIGVWSSAAQTHNDGLLKRQGVLAATWKKYKASPEGDFQAGWMKARAAGLKAAGMPVIFN
ncbi:MAG: TAXI family TRAP transporter solute-binding subunit [Alphaproteobacteria bacterium]|nr:TAXI family TRAP transporter solute-binding subunit [Alphaproteobacteria bacterium]